MAPEFHNIRLTDEAYLGFSCAWAGCALQPGIPHPRLAPRRLGMGGM